MSSKIYRTEVMENKSSNLSGNVIINQPITFKIFSILILVFFIVFFGFLSFSQYKKKLTVTGFIQPSAGLMKIVSNQSGIVSKIFVKQGERIEKGQKLMRITSETFGSEGLEINEFLLLQIQKQIELIENQIKQQYKYLSTDKNSLSASIFSIKKQIDKTNEQIVLLEKRVTISKEIAEKMKALVKSGSISEINFKNQNNNTYILEQQKLELEKSLLNLNIQIENLNKDTIHKPILSNEKLKNLRIELSEKVSSLSLLKQQYERDILSPEDGIVSSIIAYKGKSISVQENTMTLLPSDSELIAYLYVPSSDFASITKGQKVLLRYHAFPYYQYGQYQGVVSETTMNLILPSESTAGLLTQPSYRVLVKLSKQFIVNKGEIISLRSGMKLDADVILAESSLIKWLLKPFLN